MGFPVRTRTPSNSLQAVSRLPKTFPPRDGPNEKGMSQILSRILRFAVAATVLSAAGAGVLAAREKELIVEPTAGLSASKTKSTAAALKAPAAPSHTLRSLPREIIRDQKFFWLRPFRPKRADVPWAAALFGTTAGLIAIDRSVGQGLSDTPPGSLYHFSHGIGKLGAPLTDAGIASAIYLIGRWRGNEHGQTTGLLGLQAVAHSQLIVQILKTATQRPRPTFSGGLVRDHNADGDFFAGGNSFPSGHAAGAWALATVVAERNSHRAWLPPTAYGLATLVSVSRITQRRHFPSDVFAGAALGFLIGRHVAYRAGPHSASKSRSFQLLPYVPAQGGAAFTVSWEF